MPHLAPLKWLLLPLFFWLSLLASMCMFWWMQSPKLPSLPSTHSHSSHLWHWS
uniref:ATP synthase F0 subunit 8 n=1 Tax=Orbinia latreillii TaxID=195264 RepID=Q1X8Z0_9ANNE|nr:ATP synthase F0 subunit 8 [Orbinia latreillii]AAX50141.1 ATP synthase F0 subunit 8 [Orbinia latreillii]